MAPTKFVEFIAILCFERRFSKQNGVIRLKSPILATPNFWSGYATATVPPAGDGPVVQTVKYKNTNYQYRK